ncbi:hypothetical protein HY024_04760 [Candidatus Curtissbacteria bacterium]|nr:hypothetical protein [Candidatus Curtissbacteria bacterium]
MSEFSPKGYAFQVTKKLTGIDAWQRAAKEPSPNNNRPLTAAFQIVSPVYIESSLGHEPESPLNTWRMKLVSALEMGIQMGTIIALHDKLSLEQAIGLKLAYNSTAATVPDALKFVINKIRNSSRTVPTLLLK